MPTIIPPNILSASALAALALTVLPVRAQDSNQTLVDALVSEGVLTATQAASVLAKVKAKAASTEKVTVSRDVRSLRVFGDMRFRFEDRDFNYYDNPAVRDDQTRYRLRLRLGAEFKFAEGWSAMLRLDTGKAANTSNVDFGNNTRRDDFALNVGVATFLYETADFPGPFDRARFWIGKHHLPFFTTGIAGFWICGDITGEGLSQELRLTDAIGAWDVTLRGGEYIQRARQVSGASGRSSEIDSLVMAQAEFSNQTVRNGVTTGLKIAPTFLAFLPSNYPGLPSGDAYIEANAPNEANYHDLSSFVLPAEFAFGIGKYPAAVFATFGHNFEGQSRARRFLLPGARLTSAMSNFYNAGLRLGDASRKGGASFTAEYRYLGAGSHTDALSHPDFNGGRNNTQGPALNLCYGFTDYMMGSISYFRSTAIAKDAGGFRAAGGTSSDGLGFRTYETVQIDLSTKF